jgi:hypothetical protein
MYRSPKDYAFTPGPAVSSLGFPDPMAYAKGASASAMLQEDVDSDDHGDNSHDSSPGNTTGFTPKDNVQASLISAYKQAYGEDSSPNSAMGGPPPLPFNDMSGPPPLPPTSAQSLEVASMLQTAKGPVAGAGITQTTLARRKWGQ